MLAAKDPHAVLMGIAEELVARIPYGALSYRLRLPKNGFIRLRVICS